MAPEGALARKPAELTFEQASTLPQSGAIPLAAERGIHLTAVDNAGKLAFMRGLGAAEVLDYRVADFTREGPFDVIIDLVAHRSVFAYRRALAPGGRALIVGGTTRALLRMLTLGALVGRLSGRRLGVMAVREGPEHFAPVADAVAAGTVEIVIDRVFPLEQVAEALTLHGEGRTLGKVVVRVKAQPQTSNT